MANVGRRVKESMVEELSTQLAERPNVLVTTIGRMPASEADALRQKLYTSQARLIVMKRRLTQRAIEQLNLAGLADLLEGSVGIVLAGEDALPTAKLIVDFHKAHEDQLTLRGAFIDGQRLDKRRIEELASLPPKPVLLAHVVAAIESPLTGLIFTLEQLIGDIAWIAEQAAATKPLPAAQIGGQAGAPPPAGAAESAPAAQAPPAEPAQDAGSSQTAAETHKPPTTQEGTPS